MVFPAYVRHIVPTIHAVVSLEELTSRSPEMHRQLAAEASTESKRGLRMKSDWEARTRRLFFPPTEAPRGGKPGHGVSGFPYAGPP